MELAKSALVLKKEGVVLQGGEPQRPESATVTLDES